MCVTMGRVGGVTQFARAPGSVSTKIQGSSPRFTTYVILMITPIITSAVYQDVRYPIKRKTGGGVS